MDMIAQRRNSPQTTTAQRNGGDLAVDDHGSLRHPAQSAAMPDIASSSGATVAGRLDLVGMTDIEVPVRLPGGLVTPARASAFVSLDDPAAKGIHMSRLFLALQDHLESREVSPLLLQSVLEAFIASHKGLSSRARVTLDFDLMLLRPALKSDNRAWRSYPASISGELTDKGFRCELAVRVTYSSTCPCSAALARQLIQERFDRDFADQNPSRETMRQWLGTEEAICATPHSQRSHADVRIALSDPTRPVDHRHLIDCIEDALKTPVQAAVKREDEQEFARLNGENLMFCEDAGRRMARKLDADARIADFLLRASHRESLHPHDAVSVVTKGIANGFRA